MSRDRSAWLILLFILLGVLVPAGCVLWFMDEAARSQAESARQNVREAYRGQLRFIRDRVDAYWAHRASALDAASKEPAAAGFLRIVKSGLADSAIILSRSGVVIYPTPMPPPSLDRIMMTADWGVARDLESQPGRSGEAAAAYARLADSATDPSIAASAAQARIRCLIRAGNREAALGVIERRFTGGRGTHGFDVQKRLIAADEQLLALHLIKPADPRYLPAAQRLARTLNDYEDIVMPSAQRLFLMGELRGLTPDLALPTWAAERLAAQFPDGNTSRLSDSGLGRTRIPGLWQLASSSGQVIALYREATVLSTMRDLLQGQNRPGGVEFAMIPPGAAATTEAISAGPLLPGWQISFVPPGTQRMDEAARLRMASYLWIGYLMIAAMALSGLLVGQAFRRQARLTRLKTDLVAAVSHELKTPLSAMRLLVESLLDEPQFEPGKTREYLELISGENARLSRLIENFLTFSRIERNRQRFEFTATRPADVIESAVYAMRERLHAPGCRLEIEITPDLPPVYADRDALVTVVLNLLDNACKYTPADKKIALLAFLEAGHVVLAVRDNGIGIPSREQKRIFRRFYQVDRRLARQTGGCGLGLSIVEFIVRAHGGTVRVKSESGVGSTFSVLLPESAA